VYILLKEKKRERERKRRKEEKREGRVSLENRCVHVYIKYKKEDYGFINL
jgi:hypothetical protein